MSTAVRRLVVLAIVFSLLSITSPAVAATSWCGHGQRWGITGLMSHEGSWIDYRGRHRHSVRTAQFVTQKTKTEWPVCPRHR